MKYFKINKDTVGQISALTVNRTVVVDGKPVVEKVNVIEGAVEITKEEYDQWFVDEEKSFNKQLAEAKAAHEKRENS